LPSGRSAPEHLATRREMWSQSPRDAKCQKIWDADKADGDAPNIGKRAVPVLVFKHDSQGTIHRSEDYQTRS